MQKMKFKLIYAPNTLCVLLALFLLLFSFDAVGGTEPFWDQIIGFLIHSIPSFLMLIMVFLSRKWPLVGAITGFIIFILFTIFFNTYREVLNFLLISLPVLLIDSLYFLVFLRRQKQKKE